MRRIVFAVLCATLVVYVLIALAFTGTGPALDSTAGYFGVLAVSFFYGPLFFLAVLCLAVSFIPIIPYHLRTLLPADDRIPFVSS
jgi:hypothetical protein